MRFAKIITISLNPVADWTFYVDDYVDGQDNVVTSELYDAAGKGVDVSRVLRSYEIENTALIVAGKENSQQYLERLRDENVDTRVIYRKGRIRENISVITKDGTLTRLMRQSPKLSSGTIQELEEALNELVIPETLVVLAGKLPEGVSIPILLDLCDYIKERKGIIALDISSMNMETVGKIQPWLMKPNKVELEELLGHSLHTMEEIKEGVLKLSRQGVEHVLASFGDEGLVYTDGKKILHAEVPELSEIKSTVGAGDAALAGFVIAQGYEYPIEKSIRLSGAFGTASCLIEGTNPPRRISVAMISNQINIHEL